MSDLFHEDVPDSYIEKVFAVMRQAPQHRFQVLTKRAERLESFTLRHAPSSNVWLGVSVENADYTWRIDHLRRAPAPVRFLSIEPPLQFLFAYAGRLSRDAKLRGIPPIDDRSSMPWGLAAALTLPVVWLLATALTRWIRHRRSERTSGSA